MTGDFKFIYIKYKNCVYFKKINYKITSLSSDEKNNILFVGFENGLFSAIKIFSSPEGIEVEELTEKVKTAKDQTNLTLPKQVSPVLHENDQSSSESDTYSSSSSSKESSSSSSGS